MARTKIERIYKFLNRYDTILLILPFLNSIERDLIGLTLIVLIVVLQNIKFALFFAQCVLADEPN